MQVRINITLKGIDGEYRCELPETVTDRAVLNMMEEVIKNGELPGYDVNDLEENFLRNYVVDCFPPTAERSEYLMVARSKTSLGLGY